MNLTVEYLKQNAVVGEFEAVTKAGTVLIYMGKGFNENEVIFYSTYYKNYISYSDNELACDEVKIKQPKQVVTLYDLLKRIVDRVNTFDTDGHKILEALKPELEKIKVEK